MLNLTVEGVLILKNLLHISLIISNRDKLKAIVIQKNYFEQTITEILIENDNSVYLLYEIL